MAFQFILYRPHFSPCHWFKWLRLTATVKLIYKMSKYFHLFQGFQWQRKKKQLYTENVWLTFINLWGKRFAFLSGYRHFGRQCALGLFGFYKDLSIYLFIYLFTKYWNKYMFKQGLLPEQAGTSQERQEHLDGECFLEHLPSPACLLPLFFWNEPWALKQ